MKEEPKAPTTAHELIHATVEKANWKHDPIDFPTTDGIKRAIEAQWLAIKALANFIDGHSSDDKSPPLSPPASRFGQGRSASSR